MEQSVKAGKQFDIVNADTLSDGSAGNIIPATFSHIRIIFPAEVVAWISSWNQTIAGTVVVVLNPASWSGSLSIATQIQVIPWISNKFQVEAAIFFNTIKFLQHNCSQTTAYCFTKSKVQNVI